jgi:DNA-binding LytR/AlgR family response regulator
MLEDLGCRMIGPIPRIDAALQAIEREELDGAVLDVNVNNEKVFPVADALLQRSIPFVFATGYGQAMLPEDYRRFPVLHKPFSARELATCVQRNFRRG